MPPEFAAIRTLLRRTRASLASSPYKRALYAAPSLRIAADVLRPKGYLSQYGQDMYVHETLLGAMRGGTFLDVGAYDGVTFSNTHCLEKRFGWTGLAIEPLTAAFEQLQRNRTCRLHRGCVGDVEGEVDFREHAGKAAMLSGMVATCDRRHRARAGAEGRVIRVPSTTLHALLRQCGIGRVDYLTVDVEGAERAVLSGIRFDQVQIDVIGVENNYGDRGVHDLLAAAGYRLIAVMGCDEIYRRSAERFDRELTAEQ